MPPKPKFTKEEIVTAALDLVSRKGVEGLTARELGTALGSSARPIFTLFKSMDELLEEVRKAAMTYFENYALHTFPEMPLFKQVGMQMVLFGLQEPKLYQFLFMQENPHAFTFEDVFGILGNTGERCIEIIRDSYQLSDQDARNLFKNIWIYTFGIGALCATQGCHFSVEQLGEMLTTEFRAMMMLIKSQQKNP